MARLPYFVGLLVFSLMAQSASTIKLDNNGGYEIVVALDEETPLPKIGANSYIRNMQTAFQAFSPKLWIATKGHFYIKSVDILVPRHWNVSSALDAEKTFDIADIQISQNVTLPRAENPNVCGEPGNFMELPSSFFDTPQDSSFGLHWKSLLHTWALYRFGVHPEHGFVGDTQFPYASKDARSQQWTVTGCSDEPILGKFSNISDPDDTSCETGNDFNENCRFVPSTVGQTATTSLMHFHWIESVTEFCDEHNHNVLAPNKQNEYCNFKSVTQVIHESPDYLAVTSPLNSAPVTTINIVQKSVTPFLYILLDRGLVQGSQLMAQYIPRGVSSLLTFEHLQNTVATVGAFPGTGNSPVDELVPWSVLGSNRGAFLDAVGLVRNDGPLQRDFSRALVTVAEKIKATNPLNGAVVLVVKYGADVNSFGTYLPEAEVINAFNEGNIMVNSIELNFPNHTGYSHLARLAQETRGSYVTLNTSGEAEGSIRSVVNYVNKTIVNYADYADVRKHWKTLRNDVMATTASVPVSSDIQGALQIFVSSTNPNLTSESFTVSSSEYFRNAKAAVKETLTFRVTKSLDWLEKGSKYTYKLEIPQNQLVGTSRVDLQVSCGMYRCATNVLARTQVSGTSDVKIELFTSVSNGLADLSSGRPVSIFAKVTKNGLPVRDALVLATVTDTVLSSTTTLRLVDDGGLSPDVQIQDGIYSAFFVPDFDSQFKVSVTVQANPTRRRRTLDWNMNVTSASRLLPVDQGDMGCRVGTCGSETIDESFVEVVELASTFRVEKVSSYRPEPSKIRLFMTLDNALSSSKIDLFWETPRLPGRNSYTVTLYDLRSASSPELLITSFDNQTKVPLPPNFKPSLSPFERVTIDKPVATTHYAIRSEYRGKKSGIKLLTIEIPDDTEPTTTEPVSTTEDDGGISSTVTVTSSKDPITTPTSDDPPTTTESDNPTTTPGQTTSESSNPTTSPPTGDPPTTTDNGDEDTKGSAISVKAVFSTILLSFIVVLRH